VLSIKKTKKTIIPNMLFLAVNNPVYICREFSCTCLGMLVGKPKPVGFQFKPTSWIETETSHIETPDDRPKVFNPGTKRKFRRR
jgi:hypothetical protein